MKKINLGKPIKESVCKDGFYVGGSVWGSVYYSVGDSVGDSIWRSVMGSVWGSVRRSIEYSTVGSVNSFLYHSVRDSIKG